MKILRPLLLLFLVFPSLLCAQTPVGRAIQVASAVLYARGADVSMNPRGDFVVAWSRALPDATPLGVFGRVYAANGSSRTGEFRFNENRLDRPYGARVTMMDDGSFVAAFLTEKYVLARRFTAKGQPLGGNIRVAQVPPGRLFNAVEVGSRGDGSFVVTWTWNEISARVYGADGQPLGPAVQVVDAALAGRSRLAVHPGGSFLVVWDEIETTGPASHEISIQGRLLNADGTPNGESFLISDRLSEDDFSFSGYDVAVDSEGNFLVTWFQRGTDPVQSSAFIRRYAPDGAPLGGPAFMGHRPAGQEIAAGPDGRFISAWNAELGSTLKVVARQLTEGGASAGPLVVLSQQSFELVPPPVLAGNGAGSFVAAWFVGRPRRGEGPILLVQRLRTE